jgi:hypothetical protein
MTGMRFTYLAIRWAALTLAALCVAHFVVMFACGGVPTFWGRVRLPMARIDGVIAGNSAVFVCSSTTGRVYAFDHDGHLVDWYQAPGRPISISRAGDVIQVHYSGHEWLLEDYRPGGGIVEAAVEKTWWGHPILVVTRPEGTTRVPLQPWYFTVVQGPWPGALVGPVFILSVLVADWAKRRRQRLAAAAD